MNKKRKYRRYTKEDKRRIIEEYEKLKKVITISPSYWQIAQKAKCSIAYAFKTIKKYKAQNQAFGIKK